MSAVGLALAATFNLVCSGTSYIGGIKKENQSQYNETFRISLDSGRWCYGACKTTSNIFGVNDTQILLKIEDDKEGNDTMISLNRENGSVLDRVRIN